MRVLSYIIIWFFMSTPLCVVAQAYTLVFLHNKADKPDLSDDQVKIIMNGHFANMKKMVEENKLLIPGPFDGGGGLFIMNTAEESKALAWIQDDPGIQAKRWEVEIIAAKLKYGKLCPMYDTGQLEAFTFVRVNSHLTKFNIKTANKSFYDYEDYIKQISNTGNLVANFYFPDRSGSVLIFLGTIDEALLDHAPGVQSTLFNYSIETIWFPTGSFCEKNH